MIQELKNRTDNELTIFKNRIKKLRNFSEVTEENIRIAFKEAIPYAKHVPWDDLESRTRETLIRFMFLTSEPVEFMI